MKIVINRCYGGFGLSPKALQWLYANGAQNLTTSVEEYFAGNIDEFERSLKVWRDFQKTGSYNWIYHIFTPDERFVLSYNDLLRNDPLLIKCVETLGKEADARFASLAIIEIPDGISWSIDDYDGMETVEEEHRSWP